MSRLRGGGLFVGCLVFVALGVFVLVSPYAENKWAGWAAIVFFGPGAVLFVIQMFRVRPDLVLGDEGISVAGGADLLWSEVDSVGVRRLAPGRAGEVIQVVLRDPEAYLDRLSGAKALGAKVNRAIGFSPLNIPYLGRNASHDTVLAAMRRHHPDLVVTSHAGDGGRVRRFHPRQLVWPAIVIAAGVAFVWWLESSDDANGAHVGDCIAIQGDDGTTARKVDCADSNARYVVVGRVDQANACDGFPQTAASMPVYKAVLCLAPNTSNHK